MGETITKAGEADSRGDIYQRITDRIVAAIEAGRARGEYPGTRAWTALYRGVNTVVLWATAQAEVCLGLTLLCLGRVLTSKSARQ